MQARLKIKVPTRVAKYFEGRGFACDFSGGSLVTSQFGSLVTSCFLSSRNAELSYSCIFSPEKRALPATPISPKSSP